MNGPKLPRRPRVSNSPLNIVRGITTLKTIYWTISRLRKLLPTLLSTAREDHFGRKLDALRKWAAEHPETNDEMLERAAKSGPWCLTGIVNGKRVRIGPYRWRGYDHGLERRLIEYAKAAPEEGIDADKLREALDGMPEEARSRFMELIVEKMHLPIIPGKNAPKDSRLYGWFEGVKQWGARVFWPRYDSPHTPWGGSARELRKDLREELKEECRPVIVIDVRDDYNPKERAWGVHMRRHRLRWPHRYRQG